MKFFELSLGVEEWNCLSFPDLLLFLLVHELKELSIVVCLLNDLLNPCASANIYQRKTLIPLEVRGVGIPEDEHDYNVFMV